MKIPVNELQHIISRLPDPEKYTGDIYRAVTSVSNNNNNNILNKDSYTSKTCPKPGTEKIPNYFYFIEFKKELGIFGYQWVITV